MGRRFGLPYWQFALTATDANRGGSVGPPVRPCATTRVVEFNDVEALERELAHGDVACVLAEPALTNMALMSLASGAADVDRHTEMLDAAARELTQAA